MNQQRIPAVWMRGGTSKGLFFHQRHLPSDSEQRDALLLRVLGSPDRFGKQIDGVGGATSSTSKIVVIRPSTRDDCDIDYLFGHVSITQPLIDYSGNCGNLTAAAAVFAVEEGLVPMTEPHTMVRIWQQNISKTIIARVPCKHGEVEIDNGFRIAGVDFDGAEITLRFDDPGGSAEAPLLPTARITDRLTVPNVGAVDVSLINAGNPTVFVAAKEVGLSGDELPAEIEGNPAVMQKLELLRAHGAVAMGLCDNAEQATQHRPGTPKIALVAASQPYRTADGTTIGSEQTDVLIRFLSMGKPHHAITGTGAIATAISAALPGSIVQAHVALGTTTDLLRIGHASGVMPVATGVGRNDDQWIAHWAQISRSARRLMEGSVLVPVPPQLRH